jgi:hypothetical protein
MQRKFGRDGVSILNHLLIFGYDSLHNLQKVLASEYSLTNGFDLEDTTMPDASEQYRPGSLRGVLKRLVDQEYLKELRPAHFQTYSDTWRVAEVIVKASGNFSSAVGKKGKEQLDEAIRAELDGMLRGEDVSSDAVIGNKHPLPEDAEVPAPKKQKRLNGTSNQATAVVDASSTKAADHINVCN